MSQEEKPGLRALEAYLEAVNVHRSLANKRYELKKEMDKLDRQISESVRTLPSFYATAQRYYPDIMPKYGSDNSAAYHAAQIGGLVLELYRRERYAPEYKLFGVEE